MANGQPPFSDPAIMSARFAGPDNGYMQMDHGPITFGPPPGLTFPQNAGMTSDGGGPVNGESLPYSWGREDRVPSSRAFSVRKMYYRS